MAETNNAQNKGRGKGLKGIVVILAIIALLVIWGVGVYNNLVGHQEAVETAVGNVENAYQVRADLIPNLVATVKDYADFEQETLTKVIEARAKATQTTLDPSNLTEEQLKAFNEAQSEVSGALSRLLVTIERYPDLKANQNYLDLQQKLESCENAISKARKDFNETAKTYNTYLRRFPNNVIANFGNFEKKPYFEAITEGAETAPNVGDLFNK